MNEPISTIYEIVSEVIEPIVGDIPVSVQISEAFDKAASKEKVQSISMELEKLKKDVEKILMLIGDTSVSEQIAAAINRSES